MDSLELERLATGLAAFPWVWTRKELEAANLRANSGYIDITDKIGEFSLDADHLIYVRFRGDNIVYFSSTLAASEPANELSETELETTYETFGADFAQLCSIFETVFGDPVYSGERTSPTFPDGEYSVYIAIWELSSGILRVRVEDEQEDSPIQLTVSITPAI